ncbi:MAG TPA: STAS domain-containing protein [Xanthomonadales bacterium]|nr:STAS domain-containing protein [Xanthomonadales bacterium]
MLPARVTRDDVARLWRELAPRPAQTIDLAHVAEIDSAGVALVLELAAAHGATVANANARYEALLAAHRVATRA